MRLLTEIEPTKRNPDTSTAKTVEEICRAMDVEDASRYQLAAYANHEAWMTQKLYLGGTARLATLQYAYSRWLMGIDDYYLTLGVRLAHRPHRTPAAP